VVWSETTKKSRPEKIAHLLRTAAADPVAVGRALPGEIRQWYRWHHGSKKYPEFEVDEAWDEHLHGLLGAPWPCPEARQLDEIMGDIDALLTSRGLGSGRFTYAHYSDAESALCRAVWCTTLHTRPEVVVETGVAHGITTRIVLEALAQNNLGHLWSIDLPFPFDHRLHAETAVAVTDACRPRWSYLEGSSRQRLPSLVAQVGHVEMFVHDSLHTAKNTMFEMEQVASVLPVGGVMLVDDIDSHEGFKAFAARHSGYRTIVCRPGDGIGLFGIAVKAASD
jgi:Methyltransferase domain